MAQRTLVVLRHAKSDWSTAELDEHRPLAARGRRDAPAVGRWLAEHVPDLQLVLCSPATRARQTWALTGSAGWPDTEPTGTPDTPGTVGTRGPRAPQIRIDERIYAASQRDLCSVLEELPDQVHTAAVVGHNPGLSDLVSALSGQPIELKTAAIAVLTWPGPWTDVWSRVADLVSHATPRG